MIRRIIGLIKLLYSIVNQKITPPYEYAKKIGVNIGLDCFVPDKNCWPSEPYLVTIGNHCQITVGARLFTHGGGHVVRDQYPEFDTFGKIVIGDWVYIGNNSLVMPGVSIGNNVLVAAGSVVTKSVPSGVVVAGNPARIICTIEEYLEKNKAFNLKTKGYTQEDKRHYLQNLQDEMFLHKKYMNE